MSDNLNSLDYAKIAYAVYGRSTGGKNYQGLPMPAWDDLTDAIKEAWITESSAVISEYKQDRLLPILELWERLVNEDIHSQQANAIFTELDLLIRKVSNVNSL